MVPFNNFLWRTSMDLAQTYHTYQGEVMRILKRTNAVITGDHFVYAQKPDGWYHGRDYVNKDAIYPWVGNTSKLCDVIASQFADEQIETVVGPAIGGVILSQWVTHHLINNLFNSTGKTMQIYAIFADDVDNKRVIKRGYGAYVKDKQCLIVEDVINSGLTVANTRDAILQAGGIVVGVGALCNRSGGKVTAQTLAVPKLFSLMNVSMEMFKEEDCPICKERGVESVRTDLGKGKEFLARIGKV